MSDFKELAKIKSDFEEEFAALFKATPCPSRHSMQYEHGLVRTCDCVGMDITRNPACLCLVKYCPKLK